MTPRTEAVSIAWVLAVLRDIALIVLTIAYVIHVW